ncbi:MAG TPA: zinc ribbon domain-containing protein [Vicinamibacterales bacterium]|jgi:hypothetical protein|nr:zinc ribbon domain-containing protein [Vicinamibacterales bacterium]
MSSETSTRGADRGARLGSPASLGSDVELSAVNEAADQSLQPWQFFVLAGLTCATIVTFIVRGEGLTTVILLTLIMGTVAVLGLAALRTIRPLVSDREDRTVMIGERTRTALEREKTLALRAIKELEFDHAMGKIANEDFQEMSGRLRTRAMRIMKQLDAGAGYREQIERDLAKRLGDRAGDAAASSRPRRAPGATASPDAAASRAATARDSAPSTDTAAAQDAAARTCASCSAVNDPDARFCKSCGVKL